MTKAEDSKQDIEIAEMRKDIDFLKMRLEDNFNQHKNDFYPSLKKLIWVTGIGYGAMVTLTILKTLKVL